jgi:hypothetical protein
MTKRKTATTLISARSKGVTRLTPEELEEFGVTIQIHLSPADVRDLSKVMARSMIEQPFVRVSRRSTILRLIREAAKT